MIFEKLSVTEIRFKTQSCVMCLGPGRIREKLANYCQPKTSTQTRCLKLICWVHLKGLNIDPSDLHFHQELCCFCSYFLHVSWVYGLELLMHLLEVKLRVQVAFVKKYSKDNFNAAFNWNRSRWNQSGRCHCLLSPMVRSKVICL